MDFACLKFILHNSVMDKINYVKYKILKAPVKKKVIDLTQGFALFINPCSGIF